jgi:hypothetical protein
MVLDPIVKDYYEKVLIPCLGRTPLARKLEKNLDRLMKGQKLDLPVDYSLESDNLNLLGKILNKAYERMGRPYATSPVKGAVRKFIDRGISEICDLSGLTEEEFMGDKNYTAENHWLSLVKFALQERGLGFKDSDKN